jgi:hypothetical protein
VWIRTALFRPDPRTSDRPIEQRFVLDSMRAHQDASAIRIRIERPAEHPIDARAFLRIALCLAEHTGGRVLDPSRRREWIPVAFRLAYAEVLDAPSTLGAPRAR